MALNLTFVLTPRPQRKYIMRVLFKVGVVALTIMPSYILAEDCDNLLKIPALEWAIDMMTIQEKK